MALTGIALATDRIAWHLYDDVQAVRMVDGTERLYVDGEYVPSDHPVQEVISYCQCSLKRDKKKFRAFWVSQQKEITYGETGA